MSKVISCEKAVAMIPDGASLLIGGFMGVGSPHRILKELVRQRRKDLTVIANDAGTSGFGIAHLVEAGLVRRLTASHIGLCNDAQRRMLAREMDVELCPQGSLAERIRAGGFGLGGVLTPTGLGTVVEEGKAVIEVDGVKYLLEKPIKAAFALLAARRSDYRGNLEYSLTARNFNVVMAMAGDTVIVEADEIVPIGVIPPDAVATPFVCVDHIVGPEAEHGRQNTDC